MSVLFLWIKYNEISSFYFMNGAWFLLTWGLTFKRKHCKILKIVFFDKLTYIWELLSCWINGTCISTVACEKKDDHWYFQIVMTHKVSSLPYTCWQELFCSILRWTKWCLLALKSRKLYFCVKRWHRIKFLCFYAQKRIRNFSSIQFWTLYYNILNDY